ncbi:hypothetical protein Tco_1206227 [Tanacetum coccineum]
MSENEDKYHDTVLDLKARAKKNEDVVLKIGKSLQGMFMLGPKLMSLYDSNSKHGLGYANPYTLKKAISHNPKLYDASCFDDLKIHVNIGDTDDILDDATKSKTSKKNELLKDQLLKAKLKHKIECCVLLSHECVNNNVQDDIEKIQRESIEIQEGMKKRINILENDVQRCQKQRLSAASSVRRPLNKDSSLKNSVLSNTKKSSEKVDVSVSTNKKTYVTSKNVVLNKKIIANVDVQIALKVKDVLCVSCAKNMLILSHDKCLANYKLNVHSKVRRALFTTPRTAKFTFEDITRVVSKTRFSVKTT